METGHVFVCQNCYRQHLRKAEVVEEHISCSCGYTFYAFGNYGLSIMLPSEEVEQRRVKRSIRKMIHSTGRCPDVEKVADDYTAVLREMEPEELLGIALDRFQEEIYGKSILKPMNIQVLYEALNRGLDVAVRYKKDKDRIVLNKLDHNDMMAEYEKKHSNIVQGYPPGRMAGWQSENMIYPKPGDEHQTG